MRKAVTVGMRAGRIMFVVLDKNVPAFLKLLMPDAEKCKSVDGFVDVADLIVKNQVSADHFYIRLKNIEMITVNDIPTQANIATPDKKIIQGP